MPLDRRHRDDPTVIDPIIGTHTPFLTRPIPTPHRPYRPNRFSTTWGKMADKKNNPMREVVVSAGVQ